MSEAAEVAGGDRVSDVLSVMQRNSNDARVRIRYVGRGGKLISVGTVTVDEFLGADNDPEEFLSERYGGGEFRCALVDSGGLYVTGGHGTFHVGGVSFNPERWDPHGRGDPAGNRSETAPETVRETAATAAANAATQAVERFAGGGGGESAIMVELFRAQSSELGELRRMLIEGKADEAGNVKTALGLMAELRKMMPQETGGGVGGAVAAALAPAVPELIASVAKIADALASRAGTAPAPASAPRPAAAGELPAARVEPVGVDPVVVERTEAVPPVEFEPMPEGVAAIAEVASNEPKTRRIVQAAAMLNATAKVEGISSTDHASAVLGVLDTELAGELIETTNPGELGEQLRSFAPGVSADLAADIDAELRRLYAELPDEDDDGQDEADRDRADQDEAEGDEAEGDGEGGDDAEG